MHRKSPCFKYVEFSYRHIIDWTAKASFEGYEYNVVESYVDGLHNYAYEFALMNVKNKQTLSRLLNIMRKSRDVVELVDFKPLNHGYPRRIIIITRSPIRTSTRYRAQLLGGIEVKDYIANGIENWGFLFPADMNLDIFLNSLKASGEVISMRSKNVDLTDILSLVSSSKVTSLLTKAELRTLRIAYKLGYFNDDREVGLEDIAKELNLSIATVDKQIRSAIRRLTGLIFNDIAMN